VFKRDVSPDVIEQNLVLEKRAETFKLLPYSLEGFFF
jgi:hypothetical protein